MSPGTMRQILSTSASYTPRWLKWPRIRTNGLTATSLRRCLGTSFSSVDS
jgi:hypothetical protein